ncbi:MAG: zinc ribbon domain-containing protein [Candidatus Omnitrophota bacterium]|jgi:putative FmdB family regulatory protein|nr:zinc ribbon domain-containing protein [Candidatus Omnitrophota bacterium]
MPTYEYQCDKCGKLFEVFQKMTDKPLSVCNNTSCKGTVKRLISAGGGFIFKGSGFYSTDYRSDNYKKREKEEKKSPAEPPCATCDNKGCSQK